MTLINLKSKPADVTEIHDPEMSKMMDELYEMDGKNDYENNDKIIGYKGECMAIKFYNYQGLDYLNHSIDKDPSFDLRFCLGDIISKVEVKVDCKHKYTERVAIEEYKIFNGETILTGVNVWNCDWVVYILPSLREIVIYSLEDFKKMWEFATKRRWGKYFNESGDGGRTANFCVFLNYFRNPYKYLRIQPKIYKIN